MPVYADSLSFAKSQIQLMILSKIEDNQNNDENFISTSNKVEGYEVEIYNFRHQFANLPDQIEFNIEYGNYDLPFEIEKYTGKLFYLISEDTRKYNRNGEKYFYLNVTITDGQIKTYFIMEIKLNDDEQIIRLDGLVNKLYFDLSSQQIGQVSISNLDLGYKNLNFEIKESENFEIDSKTGYLFIKAGQDLRDVYNNSKLDVNISGFVGLKHTLINSEVFIFNDLSTKVFNQENFDFKLEIDSDLIKSGLEAEFGLSEQYEIVSETKRPVRFKLINNELEKFCQLNLFNGVLQCFFSRLALNNVQKGVFNMLAVAYYPDNEYLQHAEYAQVKNN
jgi:hypothetical protein